MAKLITYPLKGSLEATLQLVGLIPGTGNEFETVRLSNAALVAFVEQYAGVDGDNGKEIELRKGATAIEWRYVGDSGWTSLVPLSELMVKGDPGEQVQLQKNSTHIQWKYTSASTWSDLVPLTDLRGTNGTNGRTMWPVTGAPSAALGVDGDFANDAASNMMYGPKSNGIWGSGVSYKGDKGDAGTGLKNRGAWVTGTTYQPGDYVFSTGSSTSSSMWILNGETPYVSNTLPKNDPTKWVEFVAPAGKDGVDAKNVELRKTSTAIEWRLEGDASWTVLVTLADIKGDPGVGTPGANGKTMISVTAAPANTVGVDGDFANDSTNFVMYGPKAGGVWPTGKSYKGQDGVGTPGADGSKWLTGTDAPANTVGADKDMYLRSTGAVYGPKAGGVWPASTFSLKGEPGSGGGGGDAVLLTGDQTAAGTKTFTGRITVGTAPATGAPAVPTGAGLVVYKDVVIDNPVLLTKRLNMKLGYKNEDVIPVTPNAGVATLTQYNAQQKIMLTADVSALTLKMPDASGNSEGNIYPVIDKGSMFRVFFPFAVGALTVVPGKNSYWWEIAKVLGAPASIVPGFYDIQFMGDEQWYFAPHNGKVTVVDSGSNATGYWRKYSDGMMEQAFYAAANFAVSPPAARVNMTWTFPQPFVAGPGFTLPVVTFSGAARLAGSIQPCTKAEYGQSLTTGVCAVQTTSGANLDDVRDVSWTARGWWRAPA